MYLDDSLNTHYTVAIHVSAIQDKTVLKKKKLDLSLDIMTYQMPSSLVTVSIPTQVCDCHFSYIVN